MLKKEKGPRSLGMVLQNHLGLLLHIFTVVTRIYIQFFLLLLLFFDELMLFWVQLLHIIHSMHRGHL